MDDNPLAERVEALESFRAEVRQELDITRRLIVEGDDETRRQMRLLHVELIGRIATIGEALEVAARPPKRRRP